ncbi:FAD-linked oxidase [Rhizobium sp. Leaf371]|uniref:FAD-binding oxidoreductase n=1 Tax=Rhizobium sp. Leaf371 TaxID=1736355 RepID=UPI000712F711|nr:FAD-binding oxidoreductase [Rhizobium sp. Leaf371]KQS64490.1 FAD-linked oxidase [Rhizobium sp. Leaf371]
MPDIDAVLAAITAAVPDVDIRTGVAIAALHPGEHPDNLGAAAVLAPRDVAALSTIVSICAAAGIAMVTQGGRTGLVGGGISGANEIVLSLRNLDRIVEIDPIGGVAVVEAGVTLEALQQAAAVHGLEPGIDLAARGSATLGGMASTNAGGVMAFRNGVMRHRILGLEAVLPEGGIYRDMVRVVKNSAGYDLKHLLIGAEGTLGAITGLVVKLDPVPAASATALFGLPSTEAALALMGLARATGRLRACEAMWSRYFGFTAAHFGWRETSDALPVHLAIGLGGETDEALFGVLAGLYEAICETYPETVAVVAGSGQQADDIWRLREETGLMYRAFPAAPSYDVSVPIDRLGRYLARIAPALGAIDGLSPFIFGHVADGNLHIVLDRPGSWMTDARRDAVEQVLYDGIGAMGGSFSAEHGVGSKRIHALLATADPVKLATMRAIKQALDPKGLFNPGKVLPIA